MGKGHGPDAQPKIFALKCIDRTKLKGKKAIDNVANEDFEAIVEELQYNGTPYQKLDLKKENMFGEGAYGMVYLVEHDGEHLAVKKQLARNCAIFKSLSAGQLDGPIKEMCFLRYC